MANSQRVIIRTSLVDKCAGSVCRQALVSSRSRSTCCPTPSEHAVRWKIVVSNRSMKALRQRRHPASVTPGIGGCEPQGTRSRLLKTVLVQVRPPGPRQRGEGTGLGLLDQSHGRGPIAAQSTSSRRRAKEPWLSIAFPPQRVVCRLTKKNGTPRVSS